MYRDDPVNKEHFVLVYQLRFLLIELKTPTFHFVLRDFLLFYHNLIQYVGHLLTLKKLRRAASSQWLTDTRAIKLTY